MNVLDLGCGIGDVALIAANLVGREGHGTAIDMDGAALDIARARAAEAQLAHISSEQAKVEEHHAKKPYDAVVGRHILIHTADPPAVLRQAAAQVRQRGIVAFQEYDLSRYFPCAPPKPLFDKVWQLNIGFFTRATHADIGVRLFQMFNDVGLEGIQSRAEIILDGGSSCPFYEWFSEGTRSILPKMEAMGIATAEELDVDTLAERLKQQALAVGGYVASPVLVGTFGLTH